MFHSVYQNSMIYYGQASLIYSTEIFVTFKAESKKSKCKGRLTLRHRVQNLQFKIHIYNFCPDDVYNLLLQYSIPVAIGE